VESVDATPSVSEVLARAAALCDPHGHDDSVAALVERFQDDDRPATAVPDLAGLFMGSFEEGPQVISPPAKATAVCAAWLATNFEYADDRERALRESARAAFDGRPPADIADWLAGQAIEV
jgi:hypothetical protein